MEDTISGANRGWDSQFHVKEQYLITFSLVIHKLFQRWPPVSGKIGKIGPVISGLFQRQNPSKDGWLVNRFSIFVFLRNKAVKKEPAILWFLCTITSNERFLWKQAIQYFFRGLCRMLPLFYHNDSLQEIYLFFLQPNVHYSFSLLHLCPHCITRSFSLA